MSRLCFCRARLSKKPNCGKPGRTCLLQTELSCPSAVDGLDLIWYSDVVISGGGTMNREAAALGVPVYSLFRGTMGAVDKHLAETGKLVLLESERDVREKLKFQPRDRVVSSKPKQRETLDA